MADFGAMLRVVRPLGIPQRGSVDENRRLLADIFRLIGNRLVAKPADAPAVIPSARSPDVRYLDVPEVPGAGLTRLSPRLEQTLACLLAGNSEKEAAHHLSLSQHTVHVYVKTLYRRFGVSTRAELLARHVRR